MLLEEFEPNGLCHALRSLTISEIAVDRKYIKIIRNVYLEQTASVRIMNELSDEIRIQRGVRQGCVASPFLFNLYPEIFSDILSI